MMLSLFSLSKQFLFQSLHFPWWICQEASSQGGSGLCYGSLKSGGPASSGYAYMPMEGSGSDGVSQEDTL